MTIFDTVPTPITYDHHIRDVKHIPVKFGDTNRQFKRVKFKKPRLLLIF